MAVYQSTTYTIKNTDDVVVFNGSVSSLFYLPQATGTGKSLVVKNNGNASLSIMARGNDQVEGATLFAIPIGEAFTVVDAKSGFWDVVSSFSASGGSVTPSGPQLASRATVTATTSSIAPSAVWTGTVTAPKTSALLALETDKPCVVRIYGTDAARTADSTRPYTQTPGGGTGLLFQGTTTTGLLSFVTQATLCNYDGTPADTLYLSVQSLDTGTGAIVVTLTTLRLEA